MLFNAIEKEAYSQIDLLQTFIVRYEIYSLETRKRFHELLADALLTSDPTESRAIEAAVGQFLAQLRHINEQV